MDEATRISVCGFLRRFFGVVAVGVLLLPLLMVAELVCIPEGVLNRLWNLGDRLIGGRAT